MEVVTEAGDLKIGSGVVVELACNDTKVLVLMVLAEKDLCVY